MKQSRTERQPCLGLAVLILLATQVAQAGEPRRCQINGRSIITNLSCEQLAREAGIAEPSSKLVPPPKASAKPTLEPRPPPAKPRPNPNVPAPAGAGLEDIPQALLPIGVFVILVALLVGGLKRRSARPVSSARPAGEPLLAPAPPAEEILPYQAAPVMSRYELTLYDRLKTALPECEIFPQTPLASFIRIDKKRAGSRFYSNSYRWQNRIGQQRVDFLVCRRQDLSILSAIELDDPSHEKDEARRRDEKKEKSLQDANIPLIRWRVEAMPDAPEIRREFVRKGWVGAAVRSTRNSYGRLP